MVGNTHKGIIRSGIQMDKIAVEKKWNAHWEEHKTYQFDKSKVDNKHYVLEMFSYPSGSKLHVGHWYNYGLSDSYARYKIMTGANVFQPMGFDAFGLPAENFAIKHGIHPSDSTMANVQIMRRQLRDIGALFDWDAELVTCQPDYYKWTQWIFCQLYKNGLAYRKNAPVNWCESCNTVLANEQVIDGCCERCGSQVIKKDLTQWFFGITKYAEELIEGLDTLDWPEKTKLMQKNWIGKSSGGLITFTLAGGETFDVFTTRADTLYGCTYVVLAPEHPLVATVTTEQCRESVECYKAEASKSNEIDRLSVTREKTGVFSGSYAINPINGAQVEIWIGDYVLASYGTGAVMGVPAHDERDYQFALKHDLGIVRVINSKSGEGELPYTEHGIMCNSQQFDGQNSAVARDGIIAKLESMGKGCKKTNYRLRDWLVSRQRYWGAPIPIIYCPDCGEVLDENLPVQLPYDVDFRPDGTSPLARHDGFVNDVVCPKCGNIHATREVDTLDTFVCSSWYYLRYPDNTNSDKPFDTEWIDKMLPVDKYIGGPEHACMHLLYARFITKALRDMGYLHFDEPFKSLVHQGIILGPDGNRMSKSHGNVISPDEFVSQYGSDVFRCYLAFGFKYIEGGPWSDDGIKGINKWLDRVEKFVLSAYGDYESTESFGKDEKALNKVRHNTIKATGIDYQEFGFNTAVARMMELVNAMSIYDRLPVKNRQFYQDTARDLLLVLSPLAPHLCEEMWHLIGNTDSIVGKPYPVFDSSALVDDEVEMLVQFNSKPKTRITVDSSLDAKALEQLVRDSSDIQQLVGAGSIVKVIAIPGRLINVIVK